VKPLILPYAPVRSAGRWSITSLLLVIAGGLLLWAALAAASMFVGSTGDFGWPAVGSARFRFRLESVLISSVVGAALAAAGAAYQAILRNPLADPYLLGVSSGATLFAYIWHLPWVTVLSAGAAFALGEQAFAFLGATLTMAAVFVLASRRGRLEPVTLLLVGVIVNAINGAVFILINSLIKDPATGGGAFDFLVGGIRPALTDGQMAAVASTVAAGWVVLLYLSGQLNVAVLSEAEASSLGVRIHRLRWIGLIVASLVTASAVAVSGPIGFIGLICPHLARLFVGHDQRRLLPVATALGAGLLCLADAASRLLSRQSAVGSTLPVGVLTGLMGGPFFLYLLWRSRRNTGAADGTA
jgi:iron complex transport system permease protein